MQKLNVGVLLGGQCEEREVSFNSGRTVCDHLDVACYNIIPIFVTLTGKLFILPFSFLHRGKIADFEHRLEGEAEEISWDALKDRIDFAYIAMHGRMVEDGRLQGFLEVLNIPYLGSDVLASAIGMDKVVNKRILLQQNIEVPKGVVVYPHQAVDIKQLCAELEAQQISFPYIVKPHNEGSSLGTTVVKNKEELILAIEKAQTITPGVVQAVLIEEKLEGMEFSCIVLWDYENNKPLPLPPTEIVTPKDVQFFDYEQKYMPGKSLQYTPGRCSKKDLKRIQDTCVAVMDILGFSTIGRIDGFLTPEGKIVIIDPNSFCGAAPSSFFFKQAAQINMNHTEAINHLIKTELRKYNLAMDSVVNTKKTSEKEDKKLRVGVLLGGRSNERETSLDSGRNIVYKLSPHTYDVTSIFVDKQLDLYRIPDKILVSNSTDEIQQQLEPSMKLLWSELPTQFDFIFIGLHGGEGENGCVQGSLELLGMPYNGSSVLASALCMDKYKTNAFLKASGFDVPKSKIVSLDEWKKNKEHVLQSIEADLHFPCIAKPHDDGCSVLVARAVDQKTLVESIESVFADGKKYALVEEFIQGMELTVGVIGNTKPYALPPSQAIATGDVLSIEEKFLPGAGENQTPAPLPKKALDLVRKTVEDAYQILGCKGYTRIDCFYQSAQESPTKNERVVILEPNTLPGLTPATCIFHQAAEIGLKPMEFIDLIVKLGLQEHKNTKLDADLDVRAFLPVETGQQKNAL